MTTRCSQSTDSFSVKQKSFSKNTLLIIKSPARWSCLWLPLTYSQYNWISLSSVHLYISFSPDMNHLLSADRRDKRAMRPADTSFDNENSNMSTEITTIFTFTVHESLYAFSRCFSLKSDIHFPVIAVSFQYIVWFFPTPKKTENSKYQST